MQHPLQQKVEQVRRSARNVRLLYGIGWLAAAALAVGLVLGLADFLLRSEELGVRLLFSTAALGAVGFTLWRFLWPALTADATSVQVAQRIEARFPQLQDRLSSSLEFLAQEGQDATAGSPALRRTVVAEATAQIDALPLGEVIDRKRPMPVLITAGVLLLVTALLGIAAPQSFARAARRLAMPWTQSDAWPRVNALAFVDPPARVPYGEPFRAELVDHNGKLPDLVEIYYWFEGQAAEDVQPQTMKPAGEQMVHHLGRVTRPFRYRASGGDDDSMGWHSVEVVEPPRASEVTITLHPPAYTSQPARKASRHIQAVAGTAVSIQGEADKRVSQARVLVETEEGEQNIPLKVAADGVSFSLDADGGNAWVLNQSGTYRLLLAGDDEVESGTNDRYQLNITPDAPPRVSVEQPEANTFVTPSASVPVKATVTDDLAIAKIELRFSRSDKSDAGEEVIVIFQGPLQAAVATGDQTSSGESRDVDFVWELSELGELPPGTSLLLAVAASDYRPQEEQSTPRRITIITPDQLEDRIVQRQTFLLSQLAEALAIQREARSQTQALQIQFSETGQVSPSDVVDLQSAELNQRRIDRLLAGENDGVLAQIDALLEVVRQNRLDNPDLERRIGGLGKAVRTIANTQLPAIGRDLLTGLKAGQTAMHASNDKPVGGQPASEVGDAVDAAATGQDRVIERLEELLGNLSQWDSYRRFSRQVSTLRRDQQTLAEQTSQLQGETISKTLQQLTAQQRADLAKLSQRQGELARRTEQMLSQMQRMQAELSDDPLAAQTLGDAVELARREAVSGRMRQASRQIGENQLGQAAQGQQQLHEQLTELLDTLTGRREHQLQRRLEQMKDAAEELQGLRDKANELTQRAAAAQNNPNEEEKRRELQRLEAERETQRQEIQRLARKLQRLQAEDAAQSLSQAGEHTQAANDAAGQGGEAQQREQSELAEEDLDDAQQKLQQQIKQAEQDLLDEQLARLEQSLKTMVSQQQSVNDEIIRLHQAEQDNGALSRGQRASVTALAQQQRGLMAEANDFAQQIQAAEVFHLGLTSAVREMASVALRLDDADLGDATQLSAQEALLRLEQLIEAMKEDESDQPPNNNGGAGQGGSSGPPPDGIKNIAQLKLLKLMQEMLHQRTRGYQQIRAAREWTETERTEMIALAQEQGRLAELLLKLEELATENPEDDPDSLPGEPPGDADAPFDPEVQDVLDEFKVPPNE